MIIEQLQLVAGVIGIFISLLFLFSIVVKRNDIADIAWGVGIFIVALISFMSMEYTSTLSIVLLVLAGLWGGRLSLRIFFRNIKKPEDYRYKKWRDEWGKWFYPRSYLQVYVLQGALMIVVGYPFVHASVYGAGETLGLWQFVGLGVWIIGYFFEVVGDWQLDTFMHSKPESGTVLSSGLWRFSRHPNYFGEVTMWWGMWLIVAPLSFGYVALISPIVITFLILKVSGVPMLEKRFAGNPQFEEYKKRTSVFFPLPPRK